MDAYTEFVLCCWICVLHLYIQRWVCNQKNLTAIFLQNSSSFFPLFAVLFCGIFFLCLRVILHSLWASWLWALLEWVLGMKMKKDTQHENPEESNESEGLEFQEVLIIEVQKYPALYAKASKKNKDKTFREKWLACGGTRDECFHRWRQFRHWYLCSVFRFQILTGFLRLIEWLGSWLIDFDRIQMRNCQNSARKNGLISGTATTAPNLKLGNKNRLNNAHSSVGEFSRPNHDCSIDWPGDWLMNWRIESCLFYFLLFSYVKLTFTP